MNILILGGTRFFGLNTVRELLSRGHSVTIATRGLTPDPFGESVKRLICNRRESESVKRVLRERYYDVIIDKTAYSSNGAKRVLDFARCGRYIMMSSAAVYKDFHDDITEEEFDPMSYPLIPGEREDFNYAEGKRQAESAASQCYDSFNTLFVRYPVVIGKNDYTKRLDFYVEHILDGRPMYVDDQDAQQSFITGDDAGIFMARLAETDICGAINGCGRGTVSMGDIFRYIEKKYKKRAFLTADGDPAPYNGTSSYTLNVQKATMLGYTFSDINDTIYELIDRCAEKHLRLR